MRTPSATWSCVQWKGLAALDPQQAGGRPRLISVDDVEFIVTADAAETLGLPFTHWSLRKLAACRPVTGPGRADRAGAAAADPACPRYLPADRTWKESADPDKDAKLDRIHVTSMFPDRCFAFDQFGPLSIRPAHGSIWARQKKSRRLPAIPSPHGIRYLHGCYSLGDDQVRGITRRREGGDHTLSALKSIRILILTAPRLRDPDNLSANKTPAIRAWAAKKRSGLLHAASASWANPIEAQFGPLRTF